VYRIKVVDGVPGVEYYSDLDSRSRIKKEMFARYRILPSTVSLEELPQEQESLFYLRFNMVIGKKKVGDHGYLYKCKAGITRG
jgi:hypothetical protein